MIIYTTEDMIKEFGEKETDNKIHHFKCKLEKSIESELKYRIVKSDKDRNTTTHFILDNTNNYKILAFFTLKIDRIEKSLLGNTVFEEKSDDKFNSVYYIVFLARDDGANKDGLCGKDILDAAIEQIDDARNIVGGVNVVLIDSIKDKICKIYEEYGFTKIHTIGNKATITHLFMKLKRGI